MITYPCLRYLLLATKSYHSLRRDARCLIWLQLVPEGLHIYGYHILFAQITKTLGSTSIRHRSDTFSSDRCLVNVDPRVFIYGHLMPRISLIFADRQAAFFTSFSWLFFIEPTLHYPFLPYTSRLPDVKPGAFFFIFSFDAFIFQLLIVIIRSLCILILYDILHSCILSRPGDTCTWDRWPGHHWFMSWLVACMKQL